MGRDIWSIMCAKSLSLFSSILVMSLLKSVPGAQLPPDEPEMTAAGKSPVELIGNRSSKTYHIADCSLIKKLPSRSKIDFSSPEAAQAVGFKPCNTCKPTIEGSGMASMPLDDDSGLGAEVRKSRIAKKGKDGATVPQDEPSFGLDNGPLKFSRDIAPILAGNCMPCHKDQPKQGAFNLSSFQKLLEGSQSGPVLVPGKPDESLLVQLIIQRKMPRGGNRRLSNEAIARIQRWVSEGAVLEAGVSETDTLDKIKPSPEQIRREELAKLSPAARDQKVETAGLERLKKAAPQLDPKVLFGRNIVVFHTMPEERAKALLRTLEVQRQAILNLIGNRVESLTGPEKLSIYVLRDAGAYTEFVRSVEQREVEMGIDSHAKLNADSPYLAVIDPLAGADEPVATTRSAKPIKKKAEDSDLTPKVSRTLAGLATEALATGGLNATAKAPRWLSEGLGAYMAYSVEPGSQYYQELRTEVLQQVQLDWEKRSGEALTDQGSAALMRAMGFTLCEWLFSSGYREQFPIFVRSLSDEGVGKLDDILKACFGTDVTRQVFQVAWGEFVVSHRGRGR